jgi:hypothetical protein
MDTDGHGYQDVAKNQEQAVHPAGESNAGSKSVFIRVHPWLNYFFVRISSRILG